MKLNIKQHIPEEKDQAQKRQGAEQADYGAFMGICFCQNRALTDK